MRICLNLIDIDCETMTSAVFKVALLCKLVVYESLNHNRVTV